MKLATELTLPARAAFTLKGEPAALVQPLVIVDTDYASDVDDPVAITLALAHQQAGLGTLYGVIVSSTHANSAPGAAAQLQNYGKPAIPVYAYQGAVGAYAAGLYPISVRNRFGDTATKTKTRTDYQNEVIGYRTLLKNAPDASVVLAIVGGQTAVMNAYNSPADGISPLTGAQLFAAKVLRLEVMGGNFVGGGPEYNITRDIASAQALAATGLPIRYNGFENGNLIYCGPPPWTDPNLDSTQYAMEVFGVEGNTNTLANRRQAFDPISVDLAFRGIGARFTEQSGTVSIAGDGSTTFTAGAGAHKKITMAQSEDVIGPDLTAKIALATKPATATGAIWELTETAGGILRDKLNRGATILVGNRMNGSGTAAPARVAAPSGTGQVFNFDGVNDLLESASPAPMNVASMCAGVVFNLDTLQSGDRALIARSSGEEGWMWELGHTAGLLRATSWQLVGGVPTARSATFATSLVAGTWYMATLHNDGTTLRLRLNGQEVATVAAASQYAGPQLASLTIGARRIGSGVINAVDASIAAAGCEASGSLAAVQALEAELQAIATVKGVTLPGPGWTPDPNRYMFFATGNRWNSGFTMPAAANLNYMASKLKFGNAPYATNDFRFHFSGFALTEGGNSPQETVVPGNSIVIDAAYLRVAGIDYPLSFSGSPGVTIASAALGAWGTVTLPATLTGLADFEVITYWHVAAGENFIGAYRLQTHRGEKAWQADSLANVQSLVAADAAASSYFTAFYNLVGNETNSQRLVFGPDMMVAKGWDGRPTALCPCDSFGEARQEISSTADARRNMGWMRRWLDHNDPVHGRIPHFMMGVPGTKAQLDLTGSGSTIATRRWDVMDEIKTLNGGLAPFSVVFGESGRNDNNATATTWRNFIRAFVARIAARYPGVRIVWATMPATVTSTDRYLTLSGQTVATLWGATLQAVNDDIETLMAGTINAYMDYWLYASDPELTGKWRPGTSKPAGALAAQAGTDGTVTWNTMQTSQPLVVGQQYAININNAGTYTGRTVTATSGTGPYTVTVAETLATIIPAGSSIYEQSTPDGVHPNLGYILDTVALIPASEKAKLVA